MLNKLKSMIKEINLFPPKANTHELSEKGEKLIKSFEGYRAKAYKPHAKDVWTIGYGSTLNVYEGMKITKEEAQQMFESDVRKFVRAVNKLVKVPLTQNQFDALVSFTYNVGVNAFKKSTLRRKLNSGKYDEVPEQFMRWVYSGGKKFSGLEKRRKKEAKLFEK